MDKEVKIMYVCACTYLYAKMHMKWSIVQPLKIRGNPTICDNMDETSVHYIKGNKSDREKTNTV